MLTASDIVSFADRQGFQLRRGGCSTPSYTRDKCVCPRRTLANEVTEDGSMYGKNVIGAIQEKFGLTEFDQECLETGFEGWQDKLTTSECKSNKYYKLGKKLYRLVNSSPV